MEKISEIWIIDEHGKPLFNQSIDNMVDPMLFGGFLSAIQQFVQTSFQGSKIEKLFFGESKISFLHLKEHQIYVILRSHKKKKDKDIHALLEKIGNLFVATFREKLAKSISNISEFRRFGKILDAHLKKEEELLGRMRSWFDQV
ncbi:MAG: hypothetical protein ACTSQI_03405 [Candidatus Helarchaeota archaeon]